MSERVAISTSVIGILSASGAALCFSLNDVGVKLLSGDYPLHQIVLVRSLFGITLTLGIFVPLDGGYAGLRTSKLHLHLMRGLCVVLANMAFFLGLAAMPLPEATAIFFVSPLIITVFSVIFLREKVGPMRWAAVGVGLAGAVLMLRPGTDSFHWAAVLPLIAAFGYAGLNILTRKIGIADRASTMAFYLQVVFIAVSSVIGLTIGDGRHAGTGDPSLDFLFREWVWFTAGDLAIVAAIGCVGACGGYLISQAYRLSEAALIAPYEYLALITAIIWGITIFGEWPDALAWLGIAVILCSGLFVMWREAVRNRQTPKTPRMRR